MEKPEDKQVDTRPESEQDRHVSDPFEAENSLSIWRAIAHFRVAVLWAFFFAIANVSGGFDSQVTGNILAVTSFRKTFGDQVGDHYVVPTHWLQAFNCVTYIGGFSGAFACAMVSDRYGRRIGLAIGIFFITIGVIMEITTTSRSVFTAAKFLFGLGNGFNLAIAPTYCSEVAPTPLRGGVLAGLNLGVLTGQLLSNSVLRGFGTGSSLWAYRAPLIFQLLFPAILAPGLLFAPESPWFLARRGDMDRARHSLRRLFGKSDPLTEERLNLIVRTIEHEKTTEGDTWVDCFRGTNGRRTVVALGGFACQHFAGIIFVLSYSTYFFELAGLSVKNALNLGVGVGCTGWVGNVLSMYILTIYGRRRLFIVGMVLMTVILLLIGIMDVVPTGAAKWVQASLTIIYNFVYNISVGALAYVILVEVSAANLRAKTAGLAAAFQQLFFVSLHFAIPYMVNPTAGNLKGKVGFVFGGTSLLMTVWAYFYVPELKNLTYRQVDLIFERKVPARKTRGYVIENGDDMGKGHDV